MNMEDFVYKCKGIKPEAKKAYLALFNSSNTRRTADKVINDLIMKFRFYGAKPTTDIVILAKQAAYREIIEYILTMSARISSDTLSEIETFINRGGNNE